MADKTGIEWTDATWNPTTGCDRVSPGCDHCYAMTLAPRLKAMGSPKYQTDGDPRTSGPGFGLAVHPDTLDQPLRWRRPRRVFVNSMSDLFHDQVPDEFFARVWAVMANSPRHTFQILTKRHGRMRSLLSSDRFKELFDIEWCAIPDWAPRLPDPDRVHLQHLGQGPLPNVWLGVSVEDQKRAEMRIPALLDTPAAVRFLSCEPLLGPVDIYASAKIDRDPGIDWVIVGGESGPGARAMDVRWARLLRDECVGASVPFLFKQWGSHDATGTPMDKHAAGRVLDGRTWDQYPTGQSA
jgi:protein gp37